MKKKLISKQLADIMRLVYLVNKKTPYCVFFSFSGHVNSIDMKIAHSKDQYLEELAKVGQLSLDLDKKDKDRNSIMRQKLSKIEKNLRKYLEPKKVIELDE